MSKMASGAPFAAALSPSAVSHNCTTASRSGRNGHELTRRAASLPSIGAHKASTARSIGSMDCRLEARAADTSSALTGPEPPASSAGRSRPSTQSLARVISLAVRVPVLSTHRMLVAPSVSIAAVRLTRTCRRARRQAPSAKKIASTMGNSSGISAIATVIPASVPATQSPSLRA